MRATVYKRLEEVIKVHDGVFVQLLNCHHSHWICVKNKNSKSNEVKVYDSMRTGDPACLEYNQQVTLSSLSEKQGC